MFLGERVQRLAGEKSKPNFTHFVIGEFGIPIAYSSGSSAWIYDKRMFFAPLESFGMKPRAIPITSGRPAAFDHVSTVSGTRIDVEMPRIRVGADRIVAFVADQKSRLGLSVSIDPSHVVRSKRFVRGDREPTVSVFVKRASPRPARRQTTTSVHLRPEPFTSTWRNIWNWSSLRFSHVSPPVTHVVRGRDLGRAGSGPVPSLSSYNQTRSQEVRTFKTETLRA